MVQANKRSGTNETRHRKRGRLQPDMPVSLCKLIFGAMSVQLSLSLSVTPSRAQHNTLNYDSQIQKDEKIKRESEENNKEYTVLLVH